MHKSVFIVGLSVLLCGCNLSNSKAPEKNKLDLEYSVLNSNERLLNWEVADLELVVPIGDTLGAVNMLRVEQNKLYVVDPTDRNLKAYSVDGVFIGNVSKGRGNAPGEIQAPVDFALDTKYVYVLDPNARRVSIFDKDGEYLSRYQINDTALSFGVGEKMAAYYSPMRPEQFIVTDKTGNTLHTWQNILSNEVSNPLALAGRIIPHTDSTFIYVPQMHSSWTEYSFRGSMVRTVSTIDNRVAWESNSEPNIVRRPKSDRVAYSASISGGLLNLHMLEGMSDGDRLAYVDRYSLESGEYTGTFSVPSFTSTLQVVSDTIYFNSKEGIKRGILKALESPN